MAKNFETYPQAILDGSTWTVIHQVTDLDTGASIEIEHTFAAGVTVPTPLPELDVVLNLIVPDTVTLDDVDDALFADDIKLGPQSETVWGNWQTRAEAIIAGLIPGFTEKDYWAAWTTGDTQATRGDAKRALESGPGGIGRGWTITFAHQHEGDGTAVDF